MDFKRFQRVGICVQAPALKKHRSIPVQTVKFEGSQNLSGCFWRLASRIEIVHAQQPLTVVMSCVEEAGSCGNERPEMQGAAR